MFRSSIYQWSNHIGYKYFDNTLFSKIFHACEQYKIVYILVFPPIKEEVQVATIQYIAKPHTIWYKITFRRFYNQENFEVQPIYS